ncbi:AI-2E family transporter [Balneola sp. MJW-20]|uniref:AI-2E family transporter n=1 Tax=Gracilimonas aurantiaca TaxID=3234185 RepID=UPI003466A04B
MRNITLDKIVRFFIAMLAIFILSVIVYNYGNLVVFLILAMLLSYVLDPLVNRIQAFGINRTLAIGATLFSVLFLLIFISTNIFPILANEVALLTSQLTVDNIQEVAITVESRLMEKFSFLPDGFLVENTSRVLSELLDINQISSVLTDALGIFTNIFSAVLVIPFAAFFFLKDGTRIRRDILRLVPNKYFETSLTLIDKIEKRLGLYFRSVLLQSLLVATTSWLTLSIAGLENSLSVGIAVGIANTIPYFGPIIGYFLSIITSIIETGNFSLVAACLLAILIVQILDNVVFQPLIFSRSADMHPVAILFIILVGAETAGILGMLVAIPIATVIKITVNQITWSLNNYQVFRSDRIQAAPPPN